MLLRLDRRSRLATELATYLPPSKLTTTSTDEPVLYPGAAQHADEDR